jgi:hypothetical protein
MAAAGSTAQEGAVYKEAIATPIVGRYRLWWRGRTKRRDRRRRRGAQRRASCSSSVTRFWAQQNRRR